MNLKETLLKVLDTDEESLKAVMDSPEGQTLMDLVSRLLVDELRKLLHPEPAAAGKKKTGKRAGL